MDTHADVHVAAVVGRVLGTRAFPADASGYAGALVWMRAHGELAKVGVEGTGSYGAGLAGRSTLKWPHCSPLIWPHPGRVAVVV